MATRVTDGARRERHEKFFFSGYRPRFARFAASPLPRACIARTKSEEKRDCSQSRTGCRDLDLPLINVLTFGGKVIKNAFEVGNLIVKSSISPSLRQITNSISCQCTKALNILSNILGTEKFGCHCFTHSAPLFIISDKRKKIRQLLSFKSCMTSLSSQRL